MATRQFNYAAMQDIYNDMNKTIGSIADPDSIAGVLNTLDENVQEYVGVCDEAIYGPLGNQLLLDWLNTSSNFANFVESFSNWSQLVAMSGGDYSQFEQDVAGFKDLNPLGTYSGGATTNFVDSEKYTVYTKEDIDDMSASILQLYAEVGDAYFVDTNMVEYEKQRKIMDIVMFSIQGVTTVLSVVPAIKLIGSGGKVAASTAKAGAGAAKAGANAEAKALTTTGAKALTTTGAKTGTGVMSKLGSKVIPKVTAAGAKVASVARAAATGVAKFAKNMTTKAGRAAIVKSAKSLIKKIPSALSKTGAKIANSKVGIAFRSLFGKSTGLTDDAIKVATKNLNKTAVKQVINGKAYTIPQQLVDDFALKKITYKEFTSAFPKMLDLTTKETADDALRFLSDQLAKNNKFARVFFDGYNAARGIVPLTTSELAIPGAATAAGEVIIDVTPKVATTATKVCALRQMMYQFGLQGVRNVAKDNLETPSAVINTGVVS